MKLVYSRQALADLNAIATYYAANASPVITEAIGTGYATSSIVFVELRRPLRVFRNVLKFAWLPSFAIHSGFSIGYETTRSIFCTFGTHRGGR